MDRHLARRYLRILGVSPGPPDAALLERLVHAQLTRVPFENISKLHYLADRGLRDIPDLELYLDGIERRGFGGTCYSNNFHLRSLLSHLGFDATFCGADMGEPDGHTVTVVDLGGRQVLVDVGYAAPFFAPLPLDLRRDHTITFGDSRYVLRPRDPRGRSRLELLRGDRCVHAYLVKPRPLQADDFARVIRNSFAEGSTFMVAVLLVRQSPARSTRIQNLTLQEHTPDSVTHTELADRDELASQICALFGMAPRVVREALARVSRFEDPFGQKNGEEETAGAVARDTVSESDIL